MEKLIGVVIVTLSTIFYAIMYPILKKTETAVPPFAVVGITSLIVFILAMTVSMVFEGTGYIKGSSFRTNLLFLLIAGILNFFAFWLLLLSYKHFPVWQVTMFTLITPIVSGIFAYYLLGEKITVNLFIGLGIMAIGLFIAVKP